MLQHHFIIIFLGKFSDLHKRSVMNLQGPIVERNCFCLEFDTKNSFKKGGRVHVILFNDRSQGRKPWFVVFICFHDWFQATNRRPWNQGARTGPGACYRLLGRWRGGGACPWPPWVQQPPDSEPVSHPPWMLRSAAVWPASSSICSRTWLLTVPSLSYSQPLCVSWILFTSPKTALTVPHLKEPTLSIPWSLQRPTSFSLELNL